MSTTKRGKVLNIPDIEDLYELYTLKARSPYEARHKNLNGALKNFREFRKRKLSMPPYDPNSPKVGDIIGCSDGDVGVVVSTHRRYNDFGDDSFMVEIAWSSGRTLTDPWRAKDFNTSQDMFHILSRA